VRKHRSVFDARVDATVMTGENGVANDLAVLRNVSTSKRAALERERLRQQLFEARKLESLGLLAGGIAHDFNNLLAAILGNAHLALETLPEDHEERAALGEIRAAAERGALLTRQLLSYAGRAPIERVPVDLSGQVREVARITQSALPTSVVLRFDLADSLPAVEVDPGQLQQVIMNLLRNASDALGPGGGEIAVRTGLARLERSELAGLVAGAGLEPGLYVHFDIADDGCGMDAETRDHLFDPFFTSKQTGHGLGLPVALGVVRAHGGGIGVDSTPGAGTCFRVFLPASSRAPEVSAADAPTALRGSGRALVADDEAQVRRVARRVLERFGYTVVEAPDGDTAREHVREAAAPFTAALLDLRMPGGGVETAHAIRALDPELPILIQSGFDPDGALERLGMDGVGFVAKPFTPQALGEALQALLTKSTRKADA
jgi:signal transduction histidine kinase/CheY-like chemotaxis protein